MLFCAINDSFSGDAWYNRWKWNRNSFSSLFIGIKFLLLIFFYIRLIYATVKRSFTVFHFVCHSFSLNFISYLICNDRRAKIRFFVFGYHYIDVTKDMIQLKCVSVVQWSFSFHLSLLLKMIYKLTKIPLYQMLCSSKWNFTQDW